MADGWHPIVPPTQPEDPYLEWAEETGFELLFAKPVGQKVAAQADYPVLLELANELTPAKFAVNANKWEGLSALIRVPTIFAEPPAGLANTRFCTAHVKRDFFTAWKNKDQRLRRAIKRFQLCAPALPRKPGPVPESEASGTAAAAATLKLDAKKPVPAVTAVIDDGIAFANAQFRSAETKSRVAWFWRQDGEPENLNPDIGSGWDLNQAAIDARLANAAAGGTVDEDEVYRASGHINFSRATHEPVALGEAHGTHVLDIAAGYDMADQRTDRPIVAVQLPVATTADTSGATLASWILEAMWYILKKANTLADKPLPVVVNLSYGLNAGPHDGSSIIEQALDDLIKARESDPKTKKAPLRIVLPSGNSRQARGHAQFELERNADRKLGWRILPDDRTPSFMEMWLPKASSKVEVTVTTPLGDSVTVREGEEVFLERSGRVVAKVLYLNAAAPGRDRPMIFFAVAPTASLDPAWGIAPFGAWTIAVENVSSKATIDAWIQRDDTPFGYPLRGRQSFFDDPDYERFDVQGKPIDDDTVHPRSYVRRDGTMNAMGTGKEVIVIGGVRRKDWQVAEYSAGGQTVNSPRRGPPAADGPDAVSVSDDSRVYTGVLGAGTRSRSVNAMNGTSVAAPRIARWIADELSRGNKADRNSVSNLANTSEGGGLPPQPTGTERRGAGRINLPPVYPINRYD